MNWLDIVLALIVAASVFSGLARGFARTVIGFVAAILAIFLSLWFYGAAGALVADYVSHKAIANFIGFALVFGGVMLAGALLGRLLAKMLKWAGLGWLDRLLGGLLGFVRGMLVAIGVVLVLCAFTRNPPPQPVVESRLAPYVLDAASVVSNLAPREMKDGFQSSYEKVKKAWNKALEAAPRTL